jgi:hypothetical protein
MTIRQILKRVETLENVHSGNDDGFVLEDLFREMWLRDRKQEIAARAKAHKSRAGGLE